GRVAAEQAAFALADGAVGLGHDPRRRALVQVELADLRLDLRHELDGRGACADHRDTLAFKAMVMVPLLGVEHLALERLQTFDVLEGRRGKTTQTGDHEASSELPAVASLDQPVLLALIPAQAAEFGAEPGVRC